MPVLGTAVVAVVGGLLGASAALALLEWRPRAEPGTGNCPTVAVAAEALPSVVTLLVQAPGGRGNGSGQLIRPGGYVLTNDHVIAAAAGVGQVSAVFDSGTAQAAGIVGRAPSLDLAVVQVRDAEDHPVIRAGSSHRLRVGQPVVALGAPLGLSGTVTSGIISSLGRDVPVPAGAEEAVLPGAIQTDASINPGNSGGPLLDCAGRLVGVNTAIATVPNQAGQSGGGSVGIGFAIPVDLALAVADELIATGTFVPPATGVSTVPLSAAGAARLGISYGLYVNEVVGDSPAARAGVRPGDILLQAGGRVLSSPDGLVLASLAMTGGGELPVVYLRNGDRVTTTLTLPRPT